MKKIHFILLVLLFAWSGVIAQTANAQQYKYVFTVAKDGTGDYKYIQDAIDAMRAYPLAPITLLLRMECTRKKLKCLHIILI